MQEEDLLLAQEEDLPLAQTEDLLLVQDEDLLLLLVRRPGRGTAKGRLLEEPTLRTP